MGTSLSKKRSYLSPNLTVVECEMYNHLLVASNEGLEFEDLFAPQVNSVDEDFYPLLP